MNDYPKISIVTPVYNQVQFLEDTIQSVLSQGYPNLEYIIVDGGSTDGTVDIIKRYADKLHYWVSEPDKGMYDALQKGFSHSTGEVMAWIGADDMYHPKSLFTIGEIFATMPQVNWLEGMNTHFDSEGRCVYCQPARPLSRGHLLAGDYEWIQQESTFWRRSLWQQAGRHIDSSLRYAGDLELWVRFSCHERLYITNALLGGFRLRGEGQLSQDHKEEYAHEAQQIIAREEPSPEARRYRRLLQFSRKRFPLKNTLLSFLSPKQSGHNIAYDYQQQRFVIQ